MKRFSRSLLYSKGVGTGPFPLEYTQFENSVLCECIFLREHFAIRPLIKNPFCILKRTKMRTFLRIACTARALVRSFGDRDACDRQHNHIHLIPPLSSRRSDFYSIRLVLVSRPNSKLFERILAEEVGVASLGMSDWLSQCLKATLIIICSDKSKFNNRQAIFCSMKLLIRFCEILS